MAEVSGAEVSATPVFDTRRLAWWAGIVGGIDTALTAVAIWTVPKRAMAAYLTAFVFWTSTTFGALAFLLIGYAAAAKWPVALRRVTEGIAFAIPALGVASIPLILEAHLIYPWTNAARGVLGAKTHYLNLVQFSIRDATYFIIMGGVGVLLCVWSIRADSARAPTSEPQRRERRLACGMLPVVGLCITFAAIDWVMSLEPNWISSVFGMYFYAGGQTAGLCAIVLLVGVTGNNRLSKLLTAHHFHALGRVILAFVVVWAYLGYFQWMLIRIANRPDEVAYFARRTHAGWSEVRWTLIVGHFALPFAVLLSKRLKQKPRFLAAVAGWLLAMHYVDMYWLVMPPLVTAMTPRWMDAVAFAGIGGFVVAASALVLHRRAVVPIGDVFLRDALNYRSAD